MRTHIQGFTLLALLVAAIWGAIQLASPALSDAFDEDGAVQAESRDEDTVDLTVGAVDDTLEFEDEVKRLQFNLLRAGFFTDLSSVDGDMGPDTRRAMAEAAEAWVSRTRPSGNSTTTRRRSSPISSSCLADPPSRFARHEWPRDRRARTHGGDDLPARAPARHRFRHPRRQDDPASVWRLLVDHRDPRRQRGHRVP